MTVRVPVLPQLRSGNVIMQTALEQRLMLMSRCFLPLCLIAVGWEQTSGHDGAGPSTRPELNRNRRQRSSKAVAIRSAIPEMNEREMSGSDAIRCDFLIRPAVLSLER
jgi:hypothetical protein